MVKKTKRILFASDLSSDMKIVFESAAAMSAYSDARIIVLHVMDETSKGARKKARMAFGDALYEDIREEQKTGARSLLSGKNVDALRIRQAIAGFLSDSPESINMPIEKVLVTESKSIAEEITQTAVEEGCGAIVMGCKQQGLLAEAMGDKVVRKVLKRSSVPVLVVPLSK